MSGHLRRVWIGLLVTKTIILEQEQLVNWSTGTLHGGSLRILLILFNDTFTAIFHISDNYWLKSVLIPMRAHGCVTCEFVIV